MNRQGETRQTHANYSFEAAAIRRRKHPRIDTNIPMHLVTNKEEKIVDGQVTNVSLGGAFIHCLAPVRIGDEVTIEIELHSARTPDGKLIDDEMAFANLPKIWTVKAVVRWMRGSGTTGIGIEFTEVDPQIRKAIELLVLQADSTAHSDESH